MGEQLAKFWWPVSSTIKLQGKKQRGDKEICGLKRLRRHINSNSVQTLTGSRFKQVNYFCFKLWLRIRNLSSRLTVDDIKILSNLINLMESILKEISPEYSLEGLMLKLKLQYFGHLMWYLTHWKRPWCWERLKVGEGDNGGWVGWMASPTRWSLS